ncbi:threonine/serine exporter family protein, partial [Acinetobacter baumannii]|nr:threonine/serine exporter family protein [Acinetobacter baumannii]
FTLFYGGFFPDSIASFFIGILLFLLLSLLGNFHTNSFFQNIFGSALVAGFSLWTTAMGWTVRYDKMIIGTLMNLVPGIAI